MIKCPVCKAPNPQNAKACNMCGKPFVEETSSYARDAAAQKINKIGPSRQTALIIIWIFPLLGAAIGGILMLGVVSRAQSAPQEGAGAAMAAACAIIPYCIARALTEIINTAAN